MSMSNSNYKPRKFKPELKQLKLNQNTNNNKNLAISNKVHLC